MNYYRYIKVFDKIPYLFFLIIFPAVLIYPQKQQYKFNQITTRDGLSGSQISSIIQDSRDYIWIGTDQGLNYYNGNEVVRFDRPKDPSDFTRTRISCLFETIDGNIWIGTRYRGLYVYDPISDHFKNYSHNPQDSASLFNKINTIYQDKNNVVWVGTDEGLNRYNIETDNFSLFKPIPDYPDQNKNKIASLVEDEQGILWIGTYEGIFHFDHEKEVFLTFDKTLDIQEKYQQINCFYQDSFGDIWFGTLKGLFKYVKKQGELMHIVAKNDEDNDFLRDDVIVSIQGLKIPGKEVLWIGTKNGLVKYDMNNDQLSRIVIDPSTPKSLSNNFINDLYLNKNGILWIGTAWSGINKLDTRGNPFHHVSVISADEKMLSPSGALFMDRKGFLWVGAYPRGLLKFDQQFNKVAQYSADKGSFIDAGSTFTNWIDCVYEDSDGDLWIGLGGWGPAIFDRENESFIYLDYNLPEGHFRPERIENILEDQSGTIWFAGDGLFYKDKAEKKHDPINIIDTNIFQIIENNISPQTGIFDIYEDTKGNLWFGTKNNGLFCLKHNERASMKFNHYGSNVSESPGLYNSSVSKTYEDINGILWATSNRGLNKFNPEIQQFELVSDTTGTFDEGVYQMFGDKKGNLWLSHWTKGLIRYQPNKKSIKIFDSNDGLPFDNLVPRYWYQSDDGRIFILSYLGEGNGFCYFHPDSIRDNLNIPRIVLTDFKVENKPFPIDSSISTIKHIRLKYNQNFFSFQFAALDYTNPEKNQFAYFLEGLNENWIYSGNRRYANYTSIPPGEYIFRVKGSNNDGYWNEEGTSISILILPPPWKTWWAYTIYGILLFGLFYAWRLYDLKRQRLKQELELEHVEAEKLKELDTIKSRFFANISHEFRTPLTLILGPLQNIISRKTDDKSKQDLNLIQRNALRLQNLINQLLNLSKLESGKMKLQASEENIVTLVNGYIQSFESLAKQKDIDLTFKTDEENIPLFIDKDKIEKILYNLLSNAFKFTGEGGKIEVTVTPFNPSSRGVIITISDNGHGIPPNKLPHIFDRFYQADDSYSKDQEGSGIGLALTKELVEVHYGKITVESEIGKGSTFTVFLPLGKEHLKPDEILEGIIKQSIGEISSNNLADLEISENIIIRDDKDKQIEIERNDDKPYILIVDDNDDLRFYIREYLINDYYISEAKDGEEGFITAIENIPDLILSDVMMPKMDGYAFCEKIKTDDRTSHIPIILLTARASSESKLKGLETGADDFITKPFDQQELLIRIKNLILQRNRLKEKFKTEIEFGLISKDRDILSMDQQFIIKAKAVVDNNISEPDFSIENFAQEMALSRVQLHRKLRALVDQSASQFIRTIKLNRAAELLIKQSGTVSEIAYDVGFNTLPYFTKCFQEQFGVNPSEFANQKH